MSKNIVLIFSRFRELVEPSSGKTGVCVTDARFNAMASSPSFSIGADSQSHARREWGYRPSLYKAPRETRPNTARAELSPCVCSSTRQLVPATPVNFPTFPTVFLLVMPIFSTEYNKQRQRNQ